MANYTVLFFYFIFYIKCFVLLNRYKDRVQRYSHNRGHGETGRMVNRGASWAKMNSLRLGLQKNY